ncbi:subtilisin-like protease SBT3.6 [Lycium barbarum]|uniref:subtilisin-like protease SBT3.6 n=1 Tax=Lycium barbarum TaxID=112863 RepID=UPI00293E1D8A|nr:subtilisin-like protease SBT3.6 [Lycium barbarum]
MGRRKHNDVELATSAHHQLLTSVLKSQEAARDSIIYSYKHGFSGFAAKLTKSQAQKIAELPDVLHVVPNHFYKLHTTRS